MIPKQPTAHPLRAIAPPSILTEPSLHPAHQEIDAQVIDYLVSTWEWPSEKAKKGFISWKLSDVVLYMFPRGETHRVQLACELLLLGFLMDDWFDHHTFAENASVVHRLDALLSSTSDNNNNNTFTPETNIEHMHSSLFARILDVQSSNDAAAEKNILDTYMRMLACHCDSTRGTSSSLREYLTFRETDVGMPICVELLYWTDPALCSVTATERALLGPLERVANYHVSILNDVFSFEREWATAKAGGEDEGSVMVNGVSVLAAETNVGVRAAKNLCLALVRAWEVEFLDLAREVLEMVAAGDGGDEVSLERVERAVLGIEGRMSGAEAFSWKTSRYL